MELWTPIPTSSTSSIWKKTNKYETISGLRSTGCAATQPFFFLCQINTSLFFEEKAAQAQVDRLNQQIPLILDCIEKMGLAGLSEIEIAALFRHVADELEKIRGKAV